VACTAALSFLIVEEDRGDLDTLYKKALLKADGHVSQGKSTTKLDFNAVAWLLLGQPPILTALSLAPCPVRAFVRKRAIMPLAGKKLCGCSPLMCWTEMGCQMYPNSHPIVALQKVLVANQGASADRRPGSAERERGE